MLTEKQVKEIRGHLERSQNPLFLFDNDSDGLCSFLILQRYIGRGKGVSVKSYPELTADYLKKVYELNSDYIFILDKPVISKEFFEKTREYNIPVVWIDHHEIQSEIPDFINYYNSLISGDKLGEPVSILCYQIARKIEDLWLAVAGSIADNYLPQIYQDFLKEFPDLGVETEKPFEVFYESRIGMVSQLINFGLMDTTTNVVKMLKFLMKVKTPYEVLEETSRNYQMHRRFKEIYSKKKKLVEKAKQGVKENQRLVYFQYGGDLSISSDIANELYYQYPNKVILVAYIKGVKANISIRGFGVKKHILKVAREIDGAKAGGHENALGAQVRVEDLEKFRENLEKVI